MSDKVKASELLVQRTGKPYLYNIMPIDNVPSVIKHGILCYNKVDGSAHRSVALDGVQERREQAVVTNTGKSLHDYANLYFDCRNPMMYRRKDMASELCILGVSPAVLDIDGCIVTDRNAASSIVRFFEPVHGIRRIDFEKVYAKVWNYPGEESKTRDHRAVKCAEVLVPGRIPFDYVLCACVFDRGCSERLLHMGFEKKIFVSRNPFFG